MADGSVPANTALAVAKAKLGLARARAPKAGTGKLPKDRDGDGKIFDGTSREQPAPQKAPGSDERSPSTPATAGSNIHSSVIAKLGAERALHVKGLIERRAPASEIADALRDAAREADDIPPTIPPGQKPTPEFWASRTYEGGKNAEQTVESLVEVAKAYAEGEIRAEKKAVFVVGAPAAGKSTFAEQLARNMGAAIWDSDDAKKVIPEFRGGIGANAVHDESKALSAFVGNKLMAENANIVHPIIGHDADKLVATMEKMKARGYEVSVVHVHVTPDEAMRRMAGRYLSTGRLIPPDYFLKVAGKPAPTYHALRDQGALDGGYAEINANGPRGSEAVTEANSVEHLGLARRNPVLGGGGASGARLPDGRAGRQGDDQRPQLRGDDPARRKQGTLVATAKAKLALTTALAEVEKAKKPGIKWFGLGGLFSEDKHPRHPKGSPKAGQFAPKNGGAGAKLTGGMSDEDWDKWFADELGDHKAGHAGKPKVGLYGGYWGGAGDHQKSAIPHPQQDDNGKAVWIERPSKPSGKDTWENPDAVATFIPGGDTPESLNGVAFAPWKPPADWNDVPVNPELEFEPPTPTMSWHDGVKAHSAKSVGAGVIIVEPDGRVWLTAPTNGYGGYRNTFPKGTREPQIASLQANAVKEAWEETGLQVEIVDVLGDFERTTSVSRYFIARRVGGTPRDMGWESQAVRLAPPEKLRQLLNMAHVDHPIVERLEKYLGVYNVKKAKGGFKVPKGPKSGAVGGGWDASKHPRWPKGTPLAGQFKAVADSGFTAAPKLAWAKDGSGPGANKEVYEKVAALQGAAEKGQWDLVAIVADNYGVDEAAMWAKTGGKGMTSKQKWKAQTNQYAKQLMAEKDAGVKATATAEKLSGPPKIANWTKVGEKPGGSAPGAIYTDEDGVKWLVKGNVFGKDDDRARNEVLASKLMALAGIPAPEMKLVDLGSAHNGGLGVATRWVDDLKLVGAKGWAKDSAQDQFAVHAWLGNYDVVGTGAGIGKADNLGYNPATDQIVNFDPGGSILYRAQGKKKAFGEFGDEVTEWDTMRGAPFGGGQVNQHAAAFFANMTSSKLVSSAAKVTSIKNDDIIDLVTAIGPGDEKARNELAWLLIARKEDIAKRAKALESAAAAAAAPKPAPKPAAAAPAAPKGPLAPPFGPSHSFHNSIVSGQRLHEKGNVAELEDLSAEWIGYGKKHNKPDYVTLGRWFGSLAHDAKGKLDVPPAPKPKPVAKPTTGPAPVAPVAAPDFEKYKTTATSGGNASHNPKIDQIKALFEKGDADGIAALSFSTNTYGKKQAKAANDALKALGSDKVVEPGQGVKGGEPKVKVTKKIVIPAAPNFKEWNGPGQGLSSKAWVNQQNQDVADSLYQLGVKGDVAAVKAATFEALDKETGAKLGNHLPVANHPSQHIKAYQRDVLHGMQNPIEEVEFTGKVKVADLFKKAVSGLSDYAKLPEKGHAAKLGRYAILGSVGNKALMAWKPKELSPKLKGDQHLSNQTLYDQSKASYNKLSAVEKQAVKEYTGSGYTSMNNPMTGVGTHGKSDYAIAAVEKASVPLPAGTVLSRKFSFAESHAANLAKLIESEGKVLKDFGIISTSTSPGVWDGDVHLRMTVGEGVKGLYVAGNPTGGGGAISQHPGENEVLLPYGTKFYVKKVHKKAFTDGVGGWGHGSSVVVEVVVLPNS